MELRISGKQLFAPGTAEMFCKIGNSDELDTKVEEILKQGEIVRKAHVAGHPNNSFNSTSDAVASATCLIHGMSKHSPDGERFFSENIRESIKIVKGFLNKK